jgi:hypothetical protein
MSETYTDLEKKELLQLARTTIEHLLADGRTDYPPTDNPKFKEKRGVFVTLHKQGDLRGCIGYPLPIKPLIESVVDNAVSSSTEDYRFNSVTLGEMGDIDIEISSVEFSRTRAEPTNLRSPLARSCGEPDQRSILGCGGRKPELLDWEGPHYTSSTGAMVEIAVCHRKYVDRSNAHGAKSSHQCRTTGTVRRTRSGIDEEYGFATLNERGIALPDFEEDDLRRQGGETTMQGWRCAGERNADPDEQRISPSASTDPEECERTRHHQHWQ